MFITRQRAQDDRAFSWVYGQAHYGKSLFWHSSELLFAFFLTEQAGLPVAWMGVVLISGLLSSAGIDLLIGSLLRWRAFSASRAIQIQLVGALASAVCLVALFATDLLPHGARIAYALAASLAFRLGYALYDIPQNALLALIAPNSHSRAWLSSLRLAFSGLAAITTAAILATLLSGAPNDRIGRYMIVAALMSLVAVGTALRLARRQAPARERQESVQSGTSISLEMGSILAAMALASFAISLFTMLEPYYVAGASGAPKRLIVLAAAVGLTCSQPLWLGITRHWSVDRARSGALVVMAASISLFGCGGFSDLGQIAMVGLFGVANGGVGMTLWTTFANSVSRRPVAGDPFAFALFTCSAKVGMATAGGAIVYILSLRQRLYGSEHMIRWGMTWPSITTLAGAFLILLISRYAPRVTVARQGGKAECGVTR